MKQLLILVCISLFIGCSSQENSSAGETKVTTSEKASITQTFPFGMNLEVYTQKPLRMTGGGDCWSTLREYVSDTITIITDSTNCGEYGETQKYFLLHQGKITIVQEKSVEINFSEDGKNVSFVLTETIHDFSIKPAVLSKRTATVDKLDFSKLNGKFEITDLKDSKRLLDDFSDKLSARLSEQQNFEMVEFSLRPSSSKTDPSTGAPSTIISLHSAIFDAPITVVKETNFTELKEFTKREKYGIPGHAAFAFSSWYAGGGAIYYGIVDGTFLSVFRKYQDEQEAPGTNKFHMIQEINLESPEEKVDHYICFKEDNGKSPHVMIAFTKNGKAVYAKYEQQSNRIRLELLREELKKEGAYPTNVTRYKEIVDGQRTGKYTITHSGNWDYLEYRRAKDGKQFKFTIDHPLSVDENGYRKTPCF